MKTFVSFYEFYIPASLFVCAAKLKAEWCWMWAYHYDAGNEATSTRERKALHNNEEGNSILLHQILIFPMWRHLQCNFNQDFTKL